MSAVKTLAALMVGLLATQLAWLIVVPAFWGPDEISHLYRTSDVVAGHWQPSTTPIADGQEGHGDLVRVAEDLVVAASSACTRHFVGDANCDPQPAPAGEPDPGEGRVWVASTAGRYNPVWYATVGQAVRVGEGAETLLALRVAGLLACDVLIALGLLLILQRRSRPLLLAALGCLTPTTVMSTATAAPNGAHYAGAFLLCAAAAYALTVPAVPSGQGSLAGPGREPARRWWLLAAACGAVVMLSTHTLGLVWFAAVSAAALVAAAPQARRLVRIAAASQNRWAAVAATVPVLATAVGCAAWIASSRVNDPRTVAGEFAGTGVPPTWGLVLGEVPTWWWQMVSMPVARVSPGGALTYQLVGVLGVAAALLTLRAARTCRRSSQVRVLVRTLELLVTLAVAVPIAATWVSFEAVGAAWQGRYALPVAFAAVMLSGVVCHHANLAATRSRRDRSPVSRTSSRSGHGSRNRRGSVLVSWAAHLAADDRSGAGGRDRAGVGASAALAGMWFAASGVSLWSAAVYHSARAGQLPTAQSALGITACSLFAAAAWAVGLHRHRCDSRAVSVDDAGAGAR